MSQEGLKVLLNRFANISLGLLNGFPVAETTRQCRTVSQVAGIFSFSFDDDFEGIVSHLS